jgi:hypothetical protein
MSFSAAASRIEATASQREDRGTRKRGRPA